MQRLRIYFLAIILIAVAAFSGCDNEVGPKYFAYVANSGSGNVAAYSINSRTGELAFIGNVGAGTEPYSVTTDPAGNFAYVANSNSRNISIYSIDYVSGALIETGDSPVDANSSKPCAIVFNPHTVFVRAYVANTDSGLITPYDADFTTGKLTRIEGLNPISCVNYSWSIVSDPSGKFIYVANRDSNVVSAFSVNLSTGGLDPISGSPFSAGTSPHSIACHPSGKFLYVANWGSDNVTAYTIDGTGALGTIGSYGAGHNPRSVACNPSGRFLYVANTNSNNISAYSINAQTGALTEMSASPFDIGPSSNVPVSITVEQSGRFAYVVNNDSDNVQAYAIDPTTGALSRIGNPVGAGHWPVSIITVRK